MDKSQSGYSKYPDKIKNAEFYNIYYNYFISPYTATGIFVICGPVL